MVRRYVRFNYFEAQLVPARVLIQEEYGEEVEPHAADAWDMSSFLDYLMVNADAFSTSIAVGSEYAEIEKDSYSYDIQKQIYSFQLSKLRETNIPSKKRIGEIKQEIFLNSDEFIGEFNSIIYDKLYGALVMQSNFYGLTVKQTEEVLTQLRFRYLDTINRTDNEPLVVKLAPIIDRAKIQNVLEAGYYKKIRVKGADFMMDAVLDDESLLSDARRMLNECSGYNIDLTISLGRTEKTATLEEEKIRNAVRSYLRIEGDRKPQVEVTSLYDEDSDVETINLFQPRMTDKVSIEVAPRQTVGHEYLYNTFMELIYSDRRQDVRRVLRPTNA